VYHTCLYCTKDLGSNEVLETLPIGRRVAFDAAQGRLWVVCGNCEKWNLVPFDTRLETIEACECLFSGARLRFSTDNIGIARLKEGLELVRIGPAQRPEFAAWRYGDQFGRRRRRHVVQAAGVIVAGLAVVVGGSEVARLVGVSGLTGFQVLNSGRAIYQGRRGVVHIATVDDERGVVTAVQLNKAAIVYDGRWWKLHVSMFRASAGGFAKGRAQTVQLHGPVAVDALGRILPRLNAAGGSREVVQDAVQLIQSQPQQFERPLAGNLKGMDKAARLALEMAAHEDTERAALAGELKLLEREWRKAEELAAIADSLAVSDDVNDQVDKRGM
jgi:hypothetical protein